MANIISGNALRDRILGEMRRERVPAPDAWLQALSNQGNRDLISIIASKHPQSVNQLSELAGRAQSNVSRSLSALINAGLVVVRLAGRASVPELTALGRAKVDELDLVVRDEAGALPEIAADAGDRPFLSLSFADEADGDDDALHGTVLAAFTERGKDEPTIARSTGDLNALAVWMLDHWWRLLYRRDAPMKIRDTAFAEIDGDRRFSIVFTSMGGHIERNVRTSDGDLAPLEKATQVVAVSSCERELLEWVVQSTADRMRSRGQFDRPVQAKLARIEDTYANRPELLFARTAGALGTSAYDLTDNVAESVRNLIEMIPDEDARLDFASAVLSDEVDEASAWALAETANLGERNQLPGLIGITRALNPLLEDWLRPHKRGTKMARMVRYRLRLEADKAIACVADLHALFGERGFESSPDAPGELRAYQSRSKDSPTVVVGDEGADATKFTLARAIGDFLVFQSATSCVADLYTERQAVGRAFAAEFIAPREGVVRMIDEEGRRVDQVARHYGADPRVIRHQWENNRHLLVGA